MIKILKNIILLYVVVFNFSYAKINIKVVEPMVFKRINTEALGSKVLAKGIVEVSTDNKDEDYGKMLKFLFPKIGYLTNKKHWIKVEGFYIEKDRNEYIITRDKEQINFYGVIDRKNLGKWSTEPEAIEGNYIGYIPINIAQYGKLINKVEINQEEI